MIEHIFEQSKFGAEFPSAAQSPILRNSLPNVHSPISRADAASHPSVTTRPLSSVTNRLGYEFPGQLVGIHVTMVAEADLGPGAAPPSAAERAFLAGRVAGQEAGGGYAHLQRTRPQTLAYGLADSPAATATATPNAASPGTSSSRP